MEAPIKLQLLKNKEIVADECIVADQFLTRFKGLMGRDSIDPGFAMLFPKCNSVHVWFMRVAIDVVFCKRTDGEGKPLLTVTSVVSGVKPWRFLPLLDTQATDVVELKAGRAENVGLQAGDELCLS